MMNTQRNSFTRFHGDDELSTRTSRASVSGVMKTVRRNFEKVSEKIRKFKHRYDMQKAEEAKIKNSNSFLQNWNKFILFLSIVALAIDPLFFYIPVINREGFCLTLDKTLKIIASAVRSGIDAFYLVHIFIQFFTGWIAPSPPGFGRRTLNNEPKTVAIRYLIGYFPIDLLSIIPYPQVLVLYTARDSNLPDSLVVKQRLKWLIFGQYFPRIFRTIHIFKDVKRASGLVTETAWIGASLNLFFYMLASHVAGSFWYLISIERQERCWREACEKNTTHCVVKYLSCQSTGNNSQVLNGSCPVINPDQISNSTVFNFGIFAEALQAEILDLGNFPKKWLFCFWWGLRNLSALGSNLKTSTYEGEVLFAAGICVAGLLLFALLIGNMQKYLESRNVRIEKVRLEKRESKEWMSHRMLPDDLRKRIRKYQKYKWQETRGIEEETILSRLPKDLRKDIKRHLCFDLLRKLPWFKAMDDLLLDALCVRLETILYTKESYIVREAEPVEELLFIMSGHLTSTTTYDDKTGFLNSVDLHAGDFCGDLLMTWAMDPKSSDHFPISSTTIKAQTNVEGFVIPAKELKFVAALYIRLHSKQARNMFRYYSVQWRTWATCLIQVTWKIHYRRKLSKALREEESKLHVGIHASRFASTAQSVLKNLRTNDAEAPKSLLPQKPADPEFLMDDK